MFNILESNKIPSYEKQDAGIRPLQIGQSDRSVGILDIIGLLVWPSHAVRNITATVTMCFTVFVFGQSVLLQHVSEQRAAAASASAQPGPQKQTYAVIIVYSKIEIDLV